VSSALLSVSGKERMRSVIVRMYSVDVDTVCRLWLALRPATRLLTHRVIATTTLHPSVSQPPRCSLISVTSINRLSDKRDCQHTLREPILWATMNAMSRARPYTHRHRHRHAAEGYVSMWGRDTTGRNNVPQSNSWPPVQR